MYKQSFDPDPCGLLQRNFANIFRPKTHLQPNGLTALYNVWA